MAEENNRWLSVKSN